MPTKRLAPYLSRTKVTPPAAPPFEVLRQTALDRVVTASTSRLVLVHAPAGFGKTTFMKQLLASYREQGLAIAWLTLDESDNDMPRFLAGFCAAIEEMKLLPSTRGNEQIRNADLALWIMDRITETQTPQAIFFDDFEALRNPVVISLIAAGIEAMPASVRIVIGSRTMPDIGLARIRARGGLTEIDVDGLRFTTQEAQEFLTQRRGVALTDSQVTQLLRRTEGWVTALWLASLALERHSDADKFLSTFSGSNAAIAAYLAEDVLAALPETLRIFLLRSSVLDELSPSLCNAVCDREDSLDLLRELERHQLFLVPVDEQHELYRYHSLFRDFLSNHLRRHNAHELPTLHLAACNAYLAAGRPIPAIQHALRSDPINVALPLLYKNIDDLLSQGRLRLLAEWLGQLPLSELNRHPRLKMIHAWCVTFTRGPKEALTLIADVDSSTLAGESASYLLALRPMLLAMMDRIDEANQLATQALPLMVSAPPFARAMIYQALTQTSIILGAHDDAHLFVDEARRAQSAAPGAFGFILAESAEALLDLMAGRLKQATARLELATKTFDVTREHGRNGNALASIQLAEAFYESGHCVEAQRILVVYGPIVQDLGPPDALISAYTLLARIVDDQGDNARALQLLNELQAAGHRLNLPRVIASARLGRSTLFLTHGDNAGALEELSLAEQAFAWPEISNRWFIANDTLTPGIVRLRWMVLNGAAAKAIPKLRAELADAERQQRGRRALKLRILLAAALHNDNQLKMALRMLERALQFAQSEGFVRTFIEEGPTVQALLKELHLEQGDNPGQRESLATLGIEQWLRGSTPNPATSAATNTLVDPLTIKEHKVLVLLGQGLSNAAMADRLFVSDSTVRTHLRNINLKLQAGSRTQAIAIARRLNLIP